MKMKTLMSRSLLGVLVVVILPMIAVAQTASIRGTVTDAQGAVIDGATITAKNVETAAERTATSSASGAYSIANLPVGRYDVTVEKQGFNLAKYSGLQVTVSQILALDVKLDVGTVAQVIEVTGQQVAPIETESAQLSNIVDEKRITELPLLTRNPYELILLSPGTNQSNTRLGGFSVNGSRERNNNFLLDGVDNNDTSVPGGSGGIAGLNPDATEEFRVITNNFLPENGRNTGAIVDIVTKGGTNDFHGTAYFFGRYHALGARDFFNHNPDALDPSQVEPQNPYVRNQFGWSLGGPILKNRTFFFVNNNYQRYTTSLTNSATVPTDDFKTGVFTFDGFPVDLNPGSPNNVTDQIFGAQLAASPSIQGLFALLPSANGPAVDDARQRLFYPSPDTNSLTDVTIKLDHRFTDKHSISARYFYNTGNLSNPFHLDFPTNVAAVDVDFRAKGVALGFTSLLRPTLINEVKFGFNRNDPGFHCTGTEVFDALSIADQFGRSSDFSTQGLTAFGCQALVSNGQSRRTGTYQVDDNLSWVKGSHTIKFGFQFRYIFDNGFDSFFSRPNLTFNTASTFGIALVDVDPSTPCNASTGAGCEGGSVLQDLVGMYYGLVDFSFQSQFFDNAGNRTPDDFRRFRQREWAGYVQDSWKIRPNLTLNFGLRYEYKGVPYEANGLLSQLFADPSGPPPFTFTLIGPGQSFYNSERTDFEPRVGFSWDPFRDGKTAIRGGYGIFHDRLFGNLFGNSKGAPPFQRDVQSFPGDFIDTLTPAATQVPSLVADNCIFDFNTFACSNQGLLATSLVDPNLRLPYSQNWNFGIQRELLSNLMLEMNYVGSKGTRLFRAVDGNPPQPDKVAQLLALGFTDQDLEDTLVVFDPALFGVFPISVFNNTAFFQPPFNTSNGFSTYHALQLNLTKRFSKGFQIQGAYTWSHAIDNANDPIDAAAGNRSFPRNSFRLDQERGQSDFDLRHRLVINYIWELPFGRGKKWASAGFLGRALEGLQLAGIVSLQSGHPYDIFGNRDSEHTGLSNRGSLMGTPTIPSGSPRNQTGPGIGSTGCSIDTLNDPPPFCDFVLPDYGGPGNIGKNTFTGPAYYNWNFTASKSVSITERVKFQLRAEVYNILNRAQFNQPGNDITSPGTFGLSTTTLTNSDGTTSARQIQVVGRITF